jgi:hypothetical protein
VADVFVPMGICSTDVPPIGVWLRVCADRYIANFLADKSADRSVWIRMGKTKD